MNDMPGILVLGANGQVGWELCRTLSPLGAVTSVSRNGDGPGGVAFDLSRLTELPALLDRLKPGAIVNAAAYTAVDRAEDDVDMAFTLNAGLPETLGKWAAARGVPVLHYSTDYVFDGSKSGAYTEADPTRPLGQYGASKLAGDQALLDSGAQAWILRVSWVYGMRGGNFLLTMKRLMGERDALNIVDDQIGAPTWSRWIAEASAQVLGQVTGRSSPPEPGVYHLSPGGSGSWFDFATQIRDLLKLDCELSPIPTSQYPTPAQRPKNSRLDPGKLRAAFGIVAPDWSELLRLCVGDEVGAAGRNT